MDAIVTAGGIPLPEEPLYTETRGHNKALLDIAGKPMVQWVYEGARRAARLDGGARDALRFPVLVLRDAIHDAIREALGERPATGNGLRRTENQL